MVYVFLAEGFELIEAMIPVDVMRRAGLQVATVSVGAQKEVKSANGVTVVADTMFAENSYAEAELLLLPGGMPGSSNLAAHEGLCKVLVERNNKNGLIAAICAAPAVVLGKLGILKNRNYTCFPTCEEGVSDGNYKATLVEVDGNLITAEGPAAALPFAYEISRRLAGADVTSKVETGMRYTHLMSGK